MRAVILSGPGRLEICKKQIPRIRSPRDVLLKISAVGVCGSDIHYYRKGRIGDQRVEYPFIIGHECSAEVAAVGGDVTRVSPGDRVAVDPAVACGVCDQCRSGRPHTCRKLKFLGCPGQMEGCLQDYIVMPEVNCFLLPRSLNPVTAVLAEPLSIADYAVSLWDRSNAGLSAAVLGAGPIGLSAVVALIEAGIQKVYLTDKIDVRLNTGVKLGAVWTGNPMDSDVTAGISASEKEGLDAVFECCGEQDALDQAVLLLKPGGQLLIIGIPETGRTGFDPHLLRRKEIRIQNVRRQNKHIPLALEQISRSSFPADTLVTHTFAMEETEKAFDLVAGYDDGVVKAVIRFDTSW